MEDQSTNENPNPSEEKKEVTAETDQQQLFDKGEAAEGKPEDVAQQPAAAEEPAAQPEAKPAKPVKEAKKQPPTTSEEKIWALVSYIPFVSIMALIMNPKSAYVKLHSRQALLLLAIVLLTSLFFIIPFLGPIIVLLVDIATIATGVFSMYQAYIGNWWKMPVLGDIAEMIPTDAFTKVTREAAMGSKVDQMKKDETEAKAETPAEGSAPEPTPEAPAAPAVEETPPAAEAEPEVTPEEPAKEEVAAPVEEAPAAPAEPEPTAPAAPEQPAVEEKADAEAQPEQPVENQPEEGDKPPA